jgi:hypothetical protein
MEKKKAILDRMARFMLLYFEPGNLEKNQRKTYCPKRGGRGDA